jgi:hypothetical protein
MPKTRQKPSVGIAKNPAKTPQKSAKNPLKICDKNFLRTKIFYQLTKN